VRLDDIRKGDDIFSYISRKKGGFDQVFYRRIIGAANEFKEGDHIVGVAAADDLSRRNARALLSKTRVGELAGHPLFNDPLYAAITGCLSRPAFNLIANMSLEKLRDFVLLRKEAEIMPVLDGLPSDVTGCLVKIMSESDLIAVGRKVCPVLPGTMLGARGYMGARIQPNSPTDNPEDIFWQVMCGFSYAVGDVVLGTNPVSSEPESVAVLERVLLDIRRVFKIEEIIPHCVLSHIDIQALLEKNAPGSTGIWFQSLAGSTAANAVFDLTLDKLLTYAGRRTGKYGFYFETGQGSEFTNGYGQGTDMVIHESRKYGLARLLKLKVAEAQRRAGKVPAPWVHVNDVAGFIGPEVFRTREQLVRCCLEDIVMGKLHGLTIGLDICSTLHMDVTLDDLDWCMDRIMPANPAYLMALPTKMDPMLGYLTTSFQDHVRLRHRFGYKVNDAMWSFFKQIGVIDNHGKPAANFGQPLRVWLRYCRARGDSRSEAAIMAEGRKQMQAVRKRGVPLAEGHGKDLWDVYPELDREIRSVYADAKKCIWAKIPSDFIGNLRDTITLTTTSKDRPDYILHPQTGEIPDSSSIQTLKRLRQRRQKAAPVQIIVSDGLNAYSITDKGNLAPYLEALRKELAKVGLPAAPELLIVGNGRVRAGYRIGEALYGGAADRSLHRGIVHVIGERPGSMHHTFSAYITAPQIEVWSKTGQADHNITRVVSGIAATALDPKTAAAASAKIVRGLFGPVVYTEE
jgi:ethanolamine ammonia-lyase large subunit